MGLIKITQPLTVIIGGYESGNENYTEQNIEISFKDLNKILEEMITCICDPYIKEIENSAHPFNGWQITSLTIAGQDQVTETDGRWAELARTAAHNGTDFSMYAIDSETGEFLRDDDGNKVLADENTYRG